MENMDTPLLIIPGYTFAYMMISVIIVSLVVAVWIIFKRIMPQKRLGTVPAKKDIFSLVGSILLLVFSIIVLW